MAAKSIKFLPLDKTPSRTSGDNEQRDSIDIELSSQGMDPFLFVPSFLQNLIRLLFDVLQGAPTHTRANTYIGFSQETSSVGENSSTCWLYCPFKRSFGCFPSSFSLSAGPDNRVPPPLTQDWTRQRRTKAITINFRLAAISGRP